VISKFHLLLIIKLLSLEAYRRMYLNSCIVLKFIYNKGIQNDANNYVEIKTYSDFGFSVVET